MRSVRASVSSSLNNPSMNPGNRLPVNATAGGPKSYSAVGGPMEEPEYQPTATLSVPPSESSSSSFSSSSGPLPAPPQTPTDASSSPLESPSTERAEFFNVPLGNWDDTRIYFPTPTSISFTGSDWSPSYESLSNSFDDDGEVESSHNWGPNRCCLWAFFIVTPIAITGVIVAIILYLMPRDLF